MSNDCLKSLTVGTGLAERRIAVRQRPATVSALKASAAPGAALSRTPGLFWLGGVQIHLPGTNTAALHGVGRPDRSGLNPVHSFGPGRLRRPVADRPVGRLAAGDRRW